MWVVNSTFSVIVDYSFMLFLTAPSYYLFSFRSRPHTFWCGSSPRRLLTWVLEARTAFRLLGALFPRSKLWISLWPRRTSAGQKERSDEWTDSGGTNPVAGVECTRWWDQCSGETGRGSSAECGEPRCGLCFIVAWSNHSVSSSCWQHWSLCNRDSERQFRDT